MSVVPVYPTLPLTIAEINNVAALVKLSPNFPVSGTPTLNNIPVFQQIELKEPNKTAVLAFEATVPLPPAPIPVVTPLPFLRQAEAVVFEPTTNLTHFFIVNIDYLTNNVGDMTVVQTNYYTKQVFPPLCQYTLELLAQWPSFDKAAVGFVGDSITDVILQNNPVSNQIRAALIARGATLAEIQNGSIRADYVGGFDGFRESNNCNGCCGELFSEKAPVKRYSTAFFRFFAPSNVITDGRAAQTSVINAPGSADAVGGLGPLAPASGPGTSYYDANARLEGLLIKLNVTDRIIEEVVDYDFQAIPNFQYDRIYRPRHSWSSTVKPINILMPEGPSTTYDPASGRFAFDNFKGYISWDGPAGLQFYNISWADTREIDDQGMPMQVRERIERSILYKASLTDDLVSYSVSSPFFRRNFTSVDSSSYPVLRRLIPLVKGVHVPANAILISVPLASRLAGTVDMGNANSFLPNSVALFERDADLITVFSGTGNVAIRGREMVARSIFRGLFYFWTFDWVFCQDGTIKCEIQVSGRLAEGLLRDQPDSIWGEYVNRNYIGLLHNHIYCYRFDFNVDGLNNTVEMEEVFPANNTKWCKKNNTCCQNAITRAKENCRELICERKSCGKEKERCHKKKVGNPPCGISCGQVPNACGHAGYAVSTHFHTELEAVTDVSPITNRIWVVHNHDSLTRFGEARGYALIPKQNGTSVAQDFSWMAEHLGFTKHNFFATPYREDEQYAAGRFPVLANNDVGLGSWIKQNRNIDNTDIVVWYTIAFAHGCHSEDTPFITNAPQGLTLVPHFFMGWNPACTLNQRINSSDAAVEANTVNNYEYVA